MQEAEANLELGRQAARAKRWREAAPLLRDAGAGFLNVAAGCPAVAARANRQGDAATAEMRTAETALSHQGRMPAARRQGPRPRPAGDHGPRREG